ncbi:hypothetical protein MKW98_019984 [Papaver atlanticum]|uniref:Prenyltransferase alpha-alpha toroid domain-containing protein n=1 Tax=Papaver atlanticum TaxID=357466 RepID=A0AAD4X618_9MAGN|nr:hypothetical protein MKW98_019984 [Papaver atlanticum]
MSCKNLDGGFGCTPGGEFHLGQIFCCMGLDGRPDKLLDVCYKERSPSWRSSAQKAASPFISSIPTPAPAPSLASQAAAEATKLLKYHSTVGVQVVIGGVRQLLEQKHLQANPCQVKADGASAADVLRIREYCIADEPQIDIVSNWNTSEYMPKVTQVGNGFSKDNKAQN